MSFKNMSLNKHGIYSFVIFRHNMSQKYSVTDWFAQYMQAELLSSKVIADVFLLISTWVDYVVLLL